MGVKRFRQIGLLLVALVVCTTASAQHTFGVTGGYGMATGRLDPKQTTRSLWGQYSAGVSWRYYGKQRFIGGFGIDLEYIQQGFSYAQNSWQVEDKKDYLWYTRENNTLMLPIVWQPHFYMLRNRIRVYLEAAATFSFQLSSTYENQLAKSNADKAGKEDVVWRGEYEFKTPRDNRWGYGLAGGGGVAFLIKQFEIHLRARYYFGYSDLLRNRNRYYNNSTDGNENPFYYTPMRSPMDNLSLSVGVSYRFNKEGFEAWKPRPKREKNQEVFKFAL